MKWRLREGRGEAIYEIGVRDNGDLAGLSCSEIDSSLRTLQQMALQLDATVTILRERQVDQDKKVIEVLIRKVSTRNLLAHHVDIMGLLPIDTERSAEHRS